VFTRSRRYETNTSNNVPPLQLPGVAGATNVRSKENYGHGHDVDDGSVGGSVMTEDTNNTSSTLRSYNVSSAQLPIMHSPSAKAHAAMSGRAGAGTHSYLTTPTMPAMTTTAPTSPAASLQHAKDYRENGDVGGGVSGIALHATSASTSTSKHQHQNDYEFSAKGDPDTMVGLVLSGLRAAVDTGEESTAFLALGRVVKLGGPGPSAVVLQRKMGGASIFPEVSILMSLHLNSAVVSAVALDALIAVSDHHPNLEQMQKANICDNTCLILSRYMDNQTMLQSCCKAIEMQSSDEGCRWRLGQANACELTSRALYKHMQVATAVKACLVTINALTYEAAHNQTRYGEYGTNELIMTVCKAYMSDPHIIRESVLSIMALAHRHKANRNKLVALQTQEFLIELMKFWAADRGVGLAIRYDARDAINALAQFQEPSPIDLNGFSLPPRKSMLAVDIVYEDGACGACFVADPAFPALDSHLAMACLPDFIRKPFRYCLANADARAYNRVTEDALETNRPALFRCMFCHVIPGVPIPVPWTFCRVTDSVEKTYFDVPPYTAKCATCCTWCVPGTGLPYYGSQTEAQICFKYPYSRQYDDYCKPYFGGIVYKAPIAPAGLEWLCIRTCAYPAVWGVIDSTRLAEAMQRQVLRVHEDGHLNAGTRG